MIGWPGELPYLRDWNLETTDDCFYFPFELERSRRGEASTMIGARSVPWGAKARWAWERGNVISARRSPRASERNQPGGPVRRRRGQGDDRGAVDAEPGRRMTGTWLFPSFRTHGSEVCFLLLNFISGDRHRTERLWGSTLECRTKKVFIFCSF